MDQVQHHLGVVFADQQLDLEQRLAIRWYRTSPPGVLTQRHLAMGARWDVARSAKCPGRCGPPPSAEAGSSWRSGRGRRPGARELQQAAR